MPVSPHDFRNVKILTGPTGSGKSAIGLRLAEEIGAEIISMDSMTLYRRMDIGTAKPSSEDRRRVPHHLMDVLEPWEPASVAWWLEQAARCVRDIESRGRTALLVGGTPLYLKAVRFGIFDGPPEDADLRHRLLAFAQEYGAAALHERLADIDAPTAQRLHPNDVRRVVRALEVYELTGKPISVWQKQWHDDSPVAGPEIWWIDRPREDLYQRINRRVERMIASGWVEEAKRLRELPQPPCRQALQALGYTELFDYLDRKQSLAETMALIQTKTRQFAKRQLTWFRQLPEACRLATHSDECSSMLIFAVRGMPEPSN